MILYVALLINTPLGIVFIKTINVAGYNHQSNSGALSHLTITYTRVQSVRTKHYNLLVLLCCLYYLILLNILHIFSCLQLSLSTYSHFYPPIVSINAVEGGRQSYSQLR